MDSLKSGNRRKRGRPLRKQEQAISDSIVDAALELFLSHGYQATSMQKIGKKASVSPTTLYAKYPNKATLFTEAVKRQVNLWQSFDGDRITKTAGQPVYNVLYAGALESIEYGQLPEVAAFFRLISQEADRFPELAKIFYDNAMAVAVKNLADTILLSEQGKQIGKIRATELAEFVIEAVTGWLNFQLLKNKTGGSAVTQRKAAERIARTIAEPLL